MFDYLSFWKLNIDILTAKEVSLSTDLKEITIKKRSDTNIIHTEIQRIHLNLGFKEEKFRELIPRRK